MTVESENTAQSMAMDTGPRFPQLAVVCNGLLSIRRREGRAASIAVEIELVKKGEVLAGAPGFCGNHQLKLVEYLGGGSQSTESSQACSLKLAPRGHDLADSLRPTNLPALDRDHKRDTMQHAVCCTNGMALI